MSDTKLTYWTGWTVFGPDGLMLFDFRSSPPPIDKRRLSDATYLSQRIIAYPEATLMNSNVWYRIVMLRRKALKDKKSAEELESICKSILGDGRKRKDQDYFEGLKNMILLDIAFFRRILEATKSDTVENAIWTYVEQTFPEDSDAKKESNLTNVYYEYLKVYKRLSKFLTREEIFWFFRKAAENVGQSDAAISCEPDKRLLTFVKSKTWYCLAEDINIETS